MGKLFGVFGLNSPPLVPGFTRNGRAGAMPVCDLCGALVSYEAQSRHLHWHKSAGF